MADEKKRATIEVDEWECRVLLDAIAIRMKEGFDSRSYDSATSLVKLARELTERQRELSQA